MTNKIPRAVRRRKERELRKAKGVVAVSAIENAIAGPHTPSSGRSSPNVPIDIDVLYRDIGILTVERDYWKERAIGTPEGLVGMDEAELITSGLAQQAQTQANQEAIEGATELAEQSVDEHLTPDEQAMRDAERFPELQDTGGKVIQEEGHPELLDGEEPPDLEPHFDEP